MLTSYLIVPLLLHVCSFIHVFKTFTFDSPPFLTNHTGNCGHILSFTFFLTLNMFYPPHTKYMCVCGGGGGYTVFRLSVILSFLDSDFVSTQYLENKFMEIDQIFHMH